MDKNKMVRLQWFGGWCFGGFLEVFVKPRKNNITYVLDKYLRDFQKYFKDKFTVSIKQINSNPESRSL